MKTKYQITCAALAESLPTFRQLIEAACKNFPTIGEKDISDLVMAVNEACSNIIMHGYVDMNPGSIVLSIELDEKEATITITDFGHPFEPCEAPEPSGGLSPEEKPEGYICLFFVSDRMDHVDYQTDASGNCLTITKRL